MIDLKLIRTNPENRERSMEKEEKTHLSSREIRQLMRQDGISLSS